MAGVHLEPRERAVGFTFQVLGELKVFDGQRAVPVTAGRQQVVLAALLLESGRLQNRDHLIRLLWAEDPPETARTQVQICVSRLRKTLAAAGVEATIETRSPGYVLQIDDAALDLNVFRRNVVEAAALGGGGRTAEAAALMRAAVSLWCGPCLNGVPSDELARIAEHIDEERLAATESFIELELALGRHHQLTAEIARLVGENPLRERFRGQLMLALYRSGRQAEALESYRQGRTLLMDELGLQPGEDLRRLEQAVLTEDPSLRLVHTAGIHLPSAEPAQGAPATDLEPHAAADEDARTQANAVVPRQLPVDTADFVGHQQLVADVEGVLTNTSRVGAPGIVVVTGRSGIGKSTFAARVAHRLAESHFPDGQLYCQLRGGRADPVDPREILGRFLRALGLPGPAIPDSLEERSEIYRSMLADRRILVVLDDAVGEEQIFPLLPGGHSCGVLVTTRARLTALPGAHRVTLDILDEQRSLELIGNVVGADRVRGEPEAARALAAAVGGLPLALRIIAARLAARPHWPLASMVQRLADERRRLDELTHGEMTVRASLALTYDGLAERDRTLLRLLSLTKGSTFPSWIGGALLDVPDAYPYPSDLMESLVDVQMLDVAGVDATGELRYGFHDIIRLFARDRLAAESDETERRSATRRVGGAWLTLVGEAQERVLGTRYIEGPAVRWNPPADHVETVLGRPLEWLDTERENLSLTVESLAQGGEDGYAWELAVNLAPFYEARGYLDHWARTHRKALTAVRRSGNLLGQAALLASLGSLHLNRRNLPEARRSLTTAVGLFEELGHTKGLGLCRRDLGLLERLAGHDTAATELFERAERDFGDDDPWARASVLVQHSVILLRRGDVRRVEAELDEALEIWRDVGYLGGQARVLQRAGQMHLYRGQPADARKALTESLTMVRDDGDVIGEGYILHDLGRVHVRLGELTEAASYFARALSVREDILDQGGAASVRVDLADLSLRDDDTAKAGVLLTDALEVFGRLGMAEEEGRATGLLARITTDGAAESR
ncbi:DNA-binding SARP family transcriptional activator [Streptomyces sp. B3I7]|uniref:AfsR/SARP family transcriptional regulator n=1 Tax=Streptomyces sp. B3I7 TaxID=3042269 RepID=UPI002785A43B|nr:BTAD domain-containing putative transcriptional regulator [Streptomyces sp. B3I7]MDQ0815154.1 DNA-binding SARP family transcriptional activator [Streptomyces sp. B3I7]